MRKNSSFSKMTFLLTLLIPPWPGLSEKFWERLINSKVEMEWAPHSPDLNPPDFFLWRFLKDNTYRNNLRIIAALKAATTAKI